MRAKHILIFFLAIALLHNNIAYPLTPSSKVADLAKESRYRYIVEKIENAEGDGTLDFQRLKKDIPGYGIKELKQMLALLIYESIYLGKISIPEELEVILWEFCRNFELDLEETKQIEFSEGEFKIYRSENRLTAHLICALLDEYFTGLEYSVSHIPRVLGWKGKYYYYQYAEGSEGFDTYKLNEVRAIGLFDRFFGFSGDFADPEDGRTDKNVIVDTRNMGRFDSLDNPILPRTWKLIDFEARGGKYRTELPKFLSEYGEDIRQVLGDEKYELLTIAVKQLLLHKDSFRRYRFQRLFRFYQEEKVREIFEEQRLGKIKVLINGAGIVGKGLASALKAIGLDVYVSDPVKERAIECVKEYNCRFIDIGEMDSVEFNLIIDASPAGQGVRNWNEIYSKFPYSPKVIFQGGEERGNHPGLRIESCNISAMGTILNPILERFSGLEIDDYYDRSKDETIEGLEEYEPYSHGTQFKEAYPEYSERIIRFDSFRKNGHIEGYHLHKAILKGEGLTSKEVKELIQSYRVLVLDETLTNGIPFEDIIEDLAGFRNTHEIPLLIVRLGDVEGGVTLEYAVPHRVNIAPDNVVGVFNILGIEDSLLLKKYQSDIGKNKDRIEDFLYRSYMYLYPLRDIFNKYLDMWATAHLDTNGNLIVNPYIDVYMIRRHIAEKYGLELPADDETCKKLIIEFIGMLFTHKFDLPGTSEIRTGDGLELLRSV